MRKMIRASAGVVGWMFALVMIAVVATFLSAPGEAFASPTTLVHIGAGLVGFAGMVTIPWDPPLTKQELLGIVDPVSANQPEVVPWQLYDTQSIANAAIGPFSFFTAQNNDKTLSNMEAGGALPDPQYFALYYVACDFLQAPVATALAGEPNAALANLENLLKTVRATFEISISNKLYGPFSLTMCHSTGGTTGFGYAYGTAANGTSAAGVNNGVPGSGGFPFSGAIVIPPKINFSLTVRLSGAATLSATVPCRMSLVGNLYRRVL